MRAAAASSAASSPIVVTPSLASVSSILGPTPQSRRTGSGARKAASVAGSDHRQAVGLAHVGGDLGHELGARDADRGGELRLVADRLLEVAADRLAGAERPLAAGRVEERLVDRDRLDAVAEALQDRHDARGLARVALHVGVQIDAFRAAAPRLGDRHRARDAEAPRLVGRGRDDAAPASALRVGADDHGLAAQLGPVALLDRRVERVHVDVQDRAGRSHEQPRSQHTQHTAERGPRVHGGVWGVLRTPSSRKGWSRESSRRPARRAGCEGASRGSWRRHKFRAAAPAHPATQASLGRSAGANEGADRGGRICGSKRMAVSAAM